MKLLQHLFEEQANLVPNNIAIVYEGKYFTYQEVNYRANQLANHLIRNFNIVPNDFILLCMERSELSIIAILAILKSGAAYVPVSTRYPQDRLNYIINEVKPKAVITDSLNYYKFIQFSEISSVFTHDSFLDYPIYNPNIKTNTGDLAYVIYTSGTTGVPKGVMIKHKSIIDKIQYLIYSHGINSSYNILAKIPYSFDPSLREIFLALSIGAKLIIADDNNYQNPQLLFNLLINEHINLMVFVPSHLSVFLEYVSTLEQLELDKLKLKLLYCCGEKLKVDLVHKARQYFKEVIIKNQYGPTEACMFSFEYNIDTISDLSDFKIVPVGKPIADTVYYIVDDLGCLVENGNIGELCLSGSGLSVGYLKKRNLSRDKFIINNFQNQYDDIKYSIIYKTGDFVRQLPDGNIEFIERIDTQVKINGYRIELSEIEIILNKHQQINQCCVIAYDDSVCSKIIAYYTSNNKCNIQDINVYLNGKLPDYMLPNLYIQIQEMPLTINGKLNRDELTKKYSNTIQKINYDNSLSIQMSDYFADVLSIDKSLINQNSDFFALGGTSLLAMKLVIKLNSCYKHKNYNIADIYQYRTIQNLLTKDIRSSFVEKDEFFEYNQNADTTIVFIPAIFSEVLYFSVAANLLNLGNVLILKQIVDNVYLDNHVEKYLSIIKNYKLKQGNSLIFIALSAGGYTAYKMSITLKHIHDIKLVFCDSDFRVFNYYDYCKRYLRFAIRGNHNPIGIFNNELIDTKILYFNATIEDKQPWNKIPIFHNNMKLRFRRLRQIKAVLEHILDTLRNLMYISTLKGLSKKHNFYKIIDIDCEHSEIFHERYTSLISNETINFISILRNDD